MQYTCTRDNSLRVSATEAILQGLAPNGGLYVPESIPILSENDIKSLSKLSYAERAAVVMSLYLDEFSVEELLEYAKSAYSSEKFGSENPAPLHRVADEYFLELWHGPTCAFKDMALQMLPHLLSASLTKSGSSHDALILTATSGDTGKAALEGFKDVERTKIVVFYPVDGVSDVQKLQMQTQEGNNVYVQAVQGNFDDTQTGVKKIFTDSSVISKIKEAGYKFSSANSINWGRLLPQIVYYLSAYCDLLAEGGITFGEKVDFCVPTGNFGNILSGYYAKCMGVPIGKLICASNSNNVLTDFINTGVYDRNRDFHSTISPSMDILISSNLERLLYHLSGNDSGVVSALMSELSTNGVYSAPEKIKSAMKELMWADYASEEETRTSIENYWRGYSYLADPHTAVAIHVSGKYINQSSEKNTLVTVSTANPYKFSDDVLAAVGVKAGGTEKLYGVSGLPIPPQIKSLKEKTVKFTGSIPRNEMPEAVLTFILGLSQDTV